MKLFWSWQSDTPGKTGRHFIREALNLAVSELKDQPELVEPSERDTLDGLEIDQDRQGVAGSTDLAPEIRKKIANCDVFIADVTSVGVIDPAITKLMAKKPGDRQPAGRKSRARKKRLINSNVAIELGYAYRTLTDSFVLLVMNDYFGSHEDMPFDIRHKAATITFTLAPYADAEERKRVQKGLVRRLVEEIRLCISNFVAEQANTVEFPTAQETSSGLYFPPGEMLAEGGEPGEQPFEFRAEQWAWLRLHPHAGEPQVGLHKIMQVFEERRTVTLSERQFPIVRRNQYGAIGFEGAGNTIHALVQGFPTGELWGINGHVIASRQVGGQSLVIIPILTFEKMFVKALTNYVAVATRALGLTPPFRVTMGVAAVRGAYIAAPGGDLGTGQYLGPIMQDAVTHAAELKKSDDAALRAILRDFFIKVWDAAAADRAAILTDAIVTGHDLPPR
jgi:hypothetical protein